MRFDASDRAEGSQVEDRRGMGLRVGAGAGGLGVVGTLVYVLFRLLGGDVGEAGQAPPSAGPSSATRAQEPHRRAATPLSGSCQGVTSATDPAKFIVCVETNVQGFWTQQFAHTGRTYEPSKLVLFTDRTSSGCGAASASSGPFYCPADAKVYLDLDFFRELEARFGARGGDFAEAYVIAHEYGHHVQDLLGTERKMRAVQQRRPDERNALSVRLELQADCYAGVWGHAAYEKGKVEHREIVDALDAAAAVGDDRIQRETRGRVSPETFTHGSSAERQKWFTTGMRTGDPAACDTFGAGL